MPFVKGKSGNPQGRPKGLINQASLRASIAADVPAIIKALTEQATSGDVGACKLLLDRVLPALRPTDQPVSLPLSGNLAESGRVVLAAVGRSEVTPDTATRLMQAIGAMAKIIETSELVARIEKLEEQQNGNGNQA